MPTKLRRGYGSLTGLVMGTKTWAVPLLMTAMVGCGTRESRNISVIADPIGVQRDEEAEKLLAVAGLHSFCFRFHGRAVDFWPEIPGNPIHSKNLRDSFNHGASMITHIGVNNAHSSSMEANLDGTFILIQGDEFSWTFRYHLLGENTGKEKASSSTTWGGVVDFASQNELLTGATTQRFVVSDIKQVLQKESDTLILGTIEFVGSDAKVVGQIPIRYAFHQNTQDDDEP